MTSLSAVESWLEEHSIENYTISEDLYITVHGSVNLNEKIKEKTLPVKFKLVNGYFDISNNSLESLEGCPEKVGKDFNCSKNELDSLLGAPIRVGDFDCSHNKLTSLSYCPKEVIGFFNCSNNQLTSIKGSPRTIKGYFRCEYNKIESLKGGPKYIDAYFDCSHNYIKELNGGPITVVQDYICNGNLLKSLDGIADTIGWDVQTDIRLNKLANSYNEEEKIWKYKGKDVVSHVYKPIVALCNKEDISRWLSKHDIKNFEILPNNSVNVKGSVKLSDKLANLSKLPLSFNEVEGDFDISNNELISLEGCPKIVHGDFLAFKNELSSLKGGPKQVSGSFIILKNNIDSLKFSPSLVKEDYICSHNPLRDLDGINNVQGSIFTGVFIPNVKAQKYVYNSVTTYKYPGEGIAEYLDKVYVTLTEEERVYEKTKVNLRNAISRLIESNSLKKEMINDTLIKNLEKYHLDEIKHKVLQIKNPKPRSKEDLTESDVLKMAFEVEL
ncbi:hypothetical protein [Arcobacter sp. YIC-80]|uniref:hypothetical protein n=1 Tax=unclassified Arcobacter TaxID=2593671 RepID=UPI00384A72DF